MIHYKPSLRGGACDQLVKQGYGRITYCAAQKILWLAVNRNGLKLEHTAAIFSVGSKPHFWSLASALDRFPVLTARYMTNHVQDRSNAVSLRRKNYAEIIVLCVNYLM